MFDDAKLVRINGKIVKSIISTEGNMTLYLNAFLKTGELSLFSNSSVIQSSETAELSAYLSRNGNVAGETVYFYEKYEPFLNLSSSNPIIQTGEKSNIKAKLTDSQDGSAIKEQRVDFYEILNPTVSLSSLNPIIQTGEKSNIQAKVKDGDGSLAKDIRVDFYEIFNPSITMGSDKAIIQKNDVAQLDAKVKDEDGSLVKDETVYFFVKED